MGLMKRPRQNPITPKMRRHLARLMGPDNRGTYASPDGRYFQLATSQAGKLRIVRTLTPDQATRHVIDGQHHPALGLRCGRRSGDPPPVFVPPRKPAKQGGKRPMRHSGLGR